MKWKASLQRQPVSSAMPYVQVMRRARLATTPVAASDFNCATGNFAMKMGTLQQGVTSSAVYCLTEVTSSAVNYHPEATSLVIPTSLRRPHEVEGQLAEGTCKLGDAVRAGHETCMLGNYTSGCE